MGKPKPTAIEFAQSCGIGDRGTTLQRSSLLRARRRCAARDKQQWNEESQAAISKVLAHTGTNTASLRLFKRASGLG
jgi:hypothetical protein